MKKVAILQSSYIPWKGYFDIIGMVDLFIFHDDIQYTKADWRNRNKIKTPKGPQWITIPCGTNEHRLICEVELKDPTWQKKHWNKIKQNYKDTRYFPQYQAIFEDIYLNKIWTNLSDLNQYIIKRISRDILGLTTRFGDSRTYNLESTKTDRVIELLIKSEADLYLSGPSGKNYLNTRKFHEFGIQLAWMDYSNYPEHSQQHPPFSHHISIIDLIFNEGENALNYMRCKNPTLKEATHKE